MARIFQGAAAANDGRNVRPPGQGHADRDRSHRLRPRRGSQARGRDIRQSETFGELFRGDPGGRSHFCRRPARQRFQDRCSGRGTQACELSVLWLGYPAADRLRPEKPQADVRGRRLLARACREGAGLPHRSRRLRRLRPGLEELFQGPAAAHDRRHHRPAGARHAGGDRPHRLRAATGLQARDRVIEWPEAAGELLGSVRDRQPCLCGRPAPERFRDRNSRRRRGATRRFPTTAPTSSCRPNTS